MPRVPEETETRLAAYLRSRGQRTALESFRSDYAPLLDAADRADMPLLRAMVLEDQQLAGVSSRGLKLLELERFATNRPRGERGEMAAAVEAQHADPTLDTVGGTSTSKSTQGRRKRRSGQHAQLPTKLAMSPTPAADPERIIDPGRAAARLTDAVGSGTYNVDEMAADWAVFAPAARLDTSDSDFDLSLRLLLHLVRASPTDSVPISDRLQFALRVLPRLLDVCSEDCVQPEPSGTDLPQQFRLQVVLLRTALEVSQAEGFRSLVTVALRSIDALRSRHAALADSPESAFDLAALDAALRKSSVALRDERHTSYTPVLRSEAWDPQSEIARAGQLWRWRYRWTAASARDGSVSPGLVRRLDRFVDECAHRHRWDLVAETWRLWVQRGWHPARHVVQLARWLAGALPAEVYGPPGPLACEVVHPHLFNRVVRLTSAEVRTGALRGAEWTVEEKNGWVDLLCSSWAASRSTRRIARELVAHWQRQRPVGGPSARPFVLRGSTLLNLVRTALPPHGDDPTYPRNLLSAHVATLVNPASPYARRTGEIEHYDLTTLAQAFTLAGDHVSVGQVYRRALEQRHLPDAKDVGVVLADAARRFPEGAYEQLGRAAAGGLRVDVSLLEAVLKAQLDQLRTSVGSQEQGGAGSFANSGTEAVESACRLATDLKFSEAQVGHVRRFGQAYLAADPDSSLKPSRPRAAEYLSVGRVLGELRKALRTLDWRLAHRVFCRTLIRDEEAGMVVAHGMRDERVLMMCVETMLKADRARGYRSERRAIREALGQVLEAAIAPAAARRGAQALDREGEMQSSVPAGNVTLLASRAGLDLVLEAYVRIGTDATVVDAVDRVMEAVRVQADMQCEAGAAYSEPSAATTQKVVRWAVARLGREEVLARGGWVGEAACEALKPRTAEDDQT
ncbi:hypothetical protein JCM8202_004247 [Rhodotorula sphaerocarpa]